MRSIAMSALGYCTEAATPTKPSHRGVAIRKNTAYLFKSPAEAKAWVKAQTDDEENDAHDYRTPDQVFESRLAPVLGYDL